MEHAFPVFAVVVVAVVALGAVERVANAAETTNFSAPATGLDPTKTTRAEDSAATRWSNLDVPKFCQVIARCKTTSFYRKVKLLPEQDEELEKVFHSYVRHGT